MPVWGEALGLHLSAIRDLSDLLLDSRGARRNAADHLAVLQQARADARDAQALMVVKPERLRLPG